MFKRMFGASTPAPAQGEVRRRVEHQLRTFGQAYKDAMGGITLAMSQVFAPPGAPTPGQKELASVRSKRDLAGQSIQTITQLWPEARTIGIKLEALHKILTELYQYTDAYLDPAQQSLAARSPAPTFDPDNARLDEVLAKQQRLTLELEQGLQEAGLNLAQIVGPEVAYELGLGRRNHPGKS